MLQLIMMNLFLICATTKPHEISYSQVNNNSSYFQLKVTIIDPINFNFLFSLIIISCFTHFRFYGKISFSSKLFSVYLVWLLESNLSKKIHTLSYLVSVKLNRAIMKIVFFNYAHPKIIFYWNIILNCLKRNFIWK